MDELGVRAGEKLAWTWATWRSVELRVVAVHEARGGGPGIGPLVERTESHYIETATGERFHDERLTMSDGKEQRTVAYHDGQRSADMQRISSGTVEFDSVTIKESFFFEIPGLARSCPEPLASVYAGSEPLHSALRVARHLNQTERLGRAADEFLILSKPGVRAFEVVCVIDGQTGIPLETRLYQDERARQEGRPLYLWTAQTVDTVDGRPIALRSRDVHYGPSGSDEIMLERDIRVVEAHFDREYAASTFWPRIGPETRVYDSISGRFQASSLTGGGTVGPEFSARSAGVAPIRAEQPRAGTGVWALGGVGLGLSLIVVALWLRRRG